MVYKTKITNDIWLQFILSRKDQVDTIEDNKDVKLLKKEI